MTSVPKPLKFLRPQYEALKAAYEQLGDAGNKKLLADVLSLLAMTRAHTSQDTLPDSLRFRLLGSDDEIGSFGHEVRARGLSEPYRQGLARRRAHPLVPASPSPLFLTPVLSSTCATWRARSLGSIATEWTSLVRVSLRE